MTARDVTDFTHFSLPGNRAIFSTFRVDFLTKLHIKPGERGKNPLEKTHKIQVETAPRNCRFLSLIVGERALIFVLIQLGIPWLSQDFPTSMFFLGFEGHAKLFDPPLLKWKTPTPPEDIRTQKLVLVLLFAA